MVGLAQMQDLLDDFWRCTVGRVPRDRLLVDQPNLTFIFIQSFPAVKAGPCNAKVPAGPGSLPGLFSMFENAQFTLMSNISIRLRTRSLTIH